MYVNTATKLLLEMLANPGYRQFLNVDQPQNVTFWAALGGKLKYEYVKSQRRALLEYIVEKTQTILPVTPAPEYSNGVYIYNLT